MYQFILSVIDSSPEADKLSSDGMQSLAKRLDRAIRSPEFAKLYSQINPDSHGEDRATIQRLEDDLMTQANYTAQMAAAVANLLADVQQAAPTQADIQTEIHTVLDPQVASLTTALQAVQSSEGNDASAIADLQGSVQSFVTAFAPVATSGSTTGSTPAPATPVTVAPTSASADSQPSASTGATVGNPSGTAASTGSGSGS